MHEIRLNPDTKVEIPQIGLFYKFQGKEYECISTITYQEQSPEPGKSYMPVFSTICRLLRIDDEGEDMGEEPISVSSDELTEI